MAWFSRHRITTSLIAMAIALGTGGVLFGAYLIEETSEVNILGLIETQLIDLRFRIRGPRQPSGDVVVVGIDARSVEAIGRWPWPRTVHARFMDQLRKWRPTTVAFDVLFTEAQGADEARRLRQIAGTLPRAGDEGDPARATRAAIESALSEVEQDRALAAALQRTFDDNAALPVLAFDFVLTGDIRDPSQLTGTMSPTDEQLVLDLASYLSRDQNLTVLRSSPPALALAVRPLVTELAQWTAALGFVNPFYDQDGTLRHYRLVAVYGSAVREAFEKRRSIAEALADPEARVQAYMPLAVSAVATHLRLSADQLVLDLAHGEISFPLPDGQRRVFSFDPFTGTAAIDFQGPDRTFPTYSYVDVLEGQVRDADGRPVDGEKAFAGKLVFVGMSDPGNTRDVFVTPFTARLPGVEQHANVAEGLLHGRQVREHRDQTLVVGLSLLVAATMGALLAANAGPQLAGLTILILTGGFLYGTFYQFKADGLIWNWTLPLLTVIFSFAGVTAYRGSVERRAKRAAAARGRFIQETFGRYLSGEVVQMLVGSPEGLQLGGERRRLTVLMSDLRGFTAHCERSSPEVVVGLLNYYLGAMTDVIFKHGGTIDEFIGDAILALFGAPVAREDDARRAVACAVEMQTLMPKVNAYLSQHGLPEVEMGVAVHTGEVVVGNIGSERRTKYGVVGSNVNLTARIESFTVGGQVFISEATLAEVGDLVETAGMIEVKAKGLEEPVKAYGVESVGPPYDLRVPKVEEELVDVLPPLPVTFDQLEGKQLGDTAMAGELPRLSMVGADMRCAERPEVLTNLKLKVWTAAGAALQGDLYAKVVDRPAGDGCCALRFTSVPPDVKAHFKSLLARRSTS